MNPAQRMPLSVNLHLTQRCNMTCRACFAKYGDWEELDADGWLRVIDAIAEETRERYRVKLSFAGGEPTLLRYLPSLVRQAHGQGMVTALITNGSKLDAGLLDELAGVLDWVGLSVDSLDPFRNKELGRTLRGTEMGEAQYRTMVAAIKGRGMRLKINTVVSSLNHREDFSEFIWFAEPERWKAMQFLLVRGQNDDAASMVVAAADYAAFLARHRAWPALVPEDNAAMAGSYIMVDPSGRLYGNRDAIHVQGEPVLEAGLLRQLDRLGYDRRGTEGRNGFYF